jgi:hypothetical protein
MVHDINDITTQDDPCSMRTIGGKSCIQIHLSTIEINCQTSKYIVNISMFNHKLIEATNCAKNSTANNVTITFRA